MSAIAWERIATDFRRTTGRVLVLALRWEDHPGGGGLMADVSIDGSPLGSTSFDWDGARPEESLAALADQLCESFLHEEVWGGWPLCPNHPGHPMWATVGRDGLAVWACESAPDHEQVPIGELGR